MLGFAADEVDAAVGRPERKLPRAVVAVVVAGKGDE